MASSQTGRIFDIGYQRYDGPRQGRNRARLAMLTSGLRQSMGLGRGGRAKVLPVLMVASSVVPAAVFLVIAALTGGAFRPIEYGDYFPITALLLLILTGILAPGLLISDRQDNVLSLYLVRPMVMFDYLAGRFLAFFAMTTVIVLAGPLILALGYTLLSSNAVDELRDNWLDFPKILLAAATIAAFLTAIPLGVAAFTPRRAYAAAVVIGVVLVFGAGVGVLTSEFPSTVETTRPITAEEREQVRVFLIDTEGLDVDEPMFGRSFETEDGDAQIFSRRDATEALETGEINFVRQEVNRLLEPEIAKWVVFADPTGAMNFVTDLLFDDLEPTDYRDLVAEHPAYYVVGVYLAWVLLPLALMWWRYRRYVA